MKVFRFYAEAGLTPNYHSGGGGIVYADSIDDAKDYIETIRSKDDDLKELEIKEIHPKLGDVFKFRDSGCCQ